ncbi:guanylate cyclase [Pseudorhodoferax soli]|uniref:GAF domain-containing protein n=1 Tax=Pseudorhodoferax soli TaxID=545864 RepID=A0A368XGC5_9BURK|nr:guanylate cyclase [Pseudorhodoferax soli]RCW66246.1 hypothetical protein DES41_111204 [Pseudorhodoferax soli]
MYGFLKELENVLGKQGVDEALGMLNRRVECRFTAIFELLDDRLFNKHFYDRLGQPRAAFLESVPWVDSFCQIAVREGKLSSPDTAADDRLDYSPYQGIVTSYHAVPIMDEALQRVWGTLCHFDVVQTDLTDPQFQELRMSAYLLLPYLRAEARRSDG